MISSIINSSKTLAEKIEELQRLSSELQFLDLLVASDRFLGDLIPFVRLVFQAYPPDSAFQFSQTNDIRVFFIRLLSKLHYGRAESAAGSAILNETLALIYDLLENENVFNRYLALRILFPLLNSGVPVDYARHLRAIGSFFANELSTTTSDDLSKCELGFFAVAEALQYLRDFHLRYGPDVIFYDQIFVSVCRALRLYFDAHGCLEHFSENKKIICEYDNFVIRLLYFTNVLELHAQHAILDYIPDLCASLSTFCPPDCYYLRREAVLAILDVFALRGYLFSSVDHYFARSLFTATSYDPLKICLMENMGRMLVLCRSECRPDARGGMHAGGPSKAVFSEFDLRVTEYLPTGKNLPLLSACLSAYMLNLTLLKNCPMDPSELKVLVLRGLDHAYVVYKLVHMESETKNEDLEGFRCPSATVRDVLTKLVEYIQVVVQSLAMLHLPLGGLDAEDLAVLAQLLLFPLNDYSSSAGPVPLATREYFRYFAGLSPSDLERIVGASAFDLLTKYYAADRLWGVLADNFAANLALVRCANALIHRDFVSFNYKSMEFYEHAFPIAYGFFKLDKKHYKNDFTDMFTVIYDYALDMPVGGACGVFGSGCVTGTDISTECINTNRSTGTECINTNRNKNACTNKNSINVRALFTILNKMFTEVKTCEAAYTGLYFIYGFFEKTVNELYTLYCLTHDPFYLECLFNIPVSLNLLVTKYAVLVRPMQAGLRSGGRLREIILKYIEYIIEFDNADGLLDDLLIELHRLIAGLGIKAMTVVSRISNTHRKALCESELRELRPVGSHELTLSCVVGSENSCNKISVKDAHGQNGLVDVEIDGAVRPLIRSLIGYEYVHDHVDIKGTNPLGLYTRTLSAVDAAATGRGTGKDTKDTARAYLKDYLMKILGLKSVEAGVLLPNVLPKPVSSGASRGTYSLEIVYQAACRNEEGFDYYNRICQSATDILLAIYMDDAPDSEAFVLSLMKVCASYEQAGSADCGRVFTDVLVDAFVYAPERAQKAVLHLFAAMDEMSQSSSDWNSLAGRADNGSANGRNIVNNRNPSDAPNNLYHKSRFASARITEMVGLVYLKDDLKSLRALMAISFYLKISIGRKEYPGFPLEEDVCLLVLYALKYKLKKIISCRIYELCLGVTKLLFSKFGVRGRHCFENVMEGSRDSSPYMGMLYSEIEFLFALNPATDAFADTIDRRCILHALGFSRTMLQRCANLVTLTEALLKTIEKRDAAAIAAYTRFLNSFANDRARFNELLAPAKKYLPTVAVLEGFPTLEARRRFVETVNRNGHLQNSNPNSFRVFRNLFYRCPISSSIKSNFIEAYAAQQPEHRAAIYDIILYSQEYDIVALDFIMTRLTDVVPLPLHAVSCLNHPIREIFNTVRARIGGSKELLRYLIDRMHVYHVSLFVEYAISSDIIGGCFLAWLSEFYAGRLGSMSNNILLDIATLSKNAFCILKYLKSKGIKCTNNRVVLLVYRDLFMIRHDQSLDLLVNWYFAAFSQEEVDMLYRINGAFVVRSEALLRKIEEVDGYYLRLWLLSALRSSGGAQPVAEKHHGMTIHGIAHGYDDENVEINEAQSSEAFIFEDTENAFSSEVDSLIAYNSDDRERSDDTSYSDVDSSLSYESASISVINGEDSRGYNVEQYDMLDDGDNESGANGDSVHVSENGSTNGSTIESASENASKNTSEKLKNTSKINEPVNANKTEYARIDISSTVNLFNGNPLPIIELFSQLDYRSDDVIAICQDSLDDSSLRYIALYYLCRFSPQKDYFSAVFKLNFQERSYATRSLMLLVDHFGIEPFTGTIKTVIRSEMRFTTSQHVLLPLIVARPWIADSPEIFLELCVMACRMFSKGDVDYGLLEIIADKIGQYKHSADASVCARLVEELNTLAILNELDTNKFVIFYDCDSFDLDRILRHKNAVAVLVYIDRALDRNSRVRQVKPSIVELVKGSAMALACTTLSKALISWLCHGDSALAPSFFIKSTVENQMSLLELLTDENNIGELTLELTKLIADSGRVDEKRFGTVLLKVIGAHSERIALWLLERNGVYDGNPNSHVPVPANQMLLTEYIPDMIPKVRPATALSLCLIPGIPQETVERNMLHLFMNFPHSLPFRKEFYLGCTSNDRVIRDAYVSLFLSQFPADPYATLEFILLTDFTNAPEAAAEYILVQALMRFLVPGDVKIRHSLLDERNSVHNTTHNTRDSARNSMCIGRLLSQDDMKNMAFLFGDTLPFISSCILAIFKQLDSTALYALYRAFLANTLGPRLEQLFATAFDSCGISPSIMHISPAPSMRLYAALGDRSMYYGAIKVRGGIREVKSIARLCLLGRYEQAIERIFEVFKGLENRTISYKKEDLRILENELEFIYQEFVNRNGLLLPEDPVFYKNDVPKGSSRSPKGRDSYKTLGAADSLYSTFNGAYKTERIECQFHELMNKIITADGTLPIREDVADAVKTMQKMLSTLFDLPHSSVMFRRVLLYASICAEITESFIILRDNQNDSIYGRFRMWMARHPSFDMPLLDWSVYMRWRLFIFNAAIGAVPESDKKKISAEMCRLSYLYASKAFKERLYQKASFILNGINGIPTIELQQSLQKYLLDIECLFASHDYATVISLVNSINISRFSGDDRSRLYHWAAKALRRMNKAADAERFGALSRKMGDIIENKKEDLDGLREHLIDVEGGGSVGISVGEGGNTIASTSTNINTSTNTDNSIYNAYNNNDNSNIEKIAILKNAYTTKLVEIINALPIAESRLFVMEFIQHGDLSRLELIQPAKLYFFAPQLRKAGISLDFLFAKCAAFKSSLGSAQALSALAARYAPEMAEYHGLLQELAELLNISESDVGGILPRIKAVAGELSRLEIRYAFERNRNPSILHAFETETVLPGQYTALRDEYNDIKTMCYVEEFGTLLHAAETILHVRNSDGTIAQVQVHKSAEDPYAPKMRRPGDSGRPAGESIKKGAAKEVKGSIIDSNTDLSTTSTGRLNEQRNAFAKQTEDGAKTRRAMASAGNAGEDDAVDQFIQLINQSIKNHQLCKHGFGIHVAQHVANVTVHERPSFSIDSALKFQLFRKSQPLALFATAYLEERQQNAKKDRLTCFASAALRWQGLFRREIAERLVSASDFYIFRKAFINSYCSLVCAQHLLGTNEISLRDTLIERMSGRVYLRRPVQGTGNAKFYIRPCVTAMLGDEGKNGPLVLLLSQFAESFLEDPANSRTVEFFFGKAKALECEKKMNRLVSDRDGNDSCESVIGEMVDPKLGLSLGLDKMAWL